MRPCSRKLALGGGRCWPKVSASDRELLKARKEPLVYDRACQRIVENQDQLPGRNGWLLARRSTSDPTDIAYYLSSAPPETDLLTLARAVSSRHTVEQCIEEAKGETGLDHYEVRYWHSWHRHITLSMMAHAWLASIRLKHNREKGMRALSGRINGARSQTITRDYLALAASLVRVHSCLGRFGGESNGYKLVGAAIVIIAATLISRCEHNRHRCGCSTKRHSI